MYSRLQAIASIPFYRTRSKSPLHAAVSALLALLALSSSSLAFGANLDRMISFNIDAPTLDQALLQFGAQADVQIVFASKTAAGLNHAGRVQGRYTGRQVLTLLLNGVGLDFVEEKGNTVEIVPKQIADAMRRTDSSDPQPGATPSPPSYGTSLHSRESKQGSSRVPASLGRVRAPLLTEVVVTGSRLLGTSDQGVQEVNVYDRRRLEQSGQNSVADFLTTLPSASVATGETAFGFVPTVQLRGLPVGTTLVLLDGRRLENSGLSFGNAYFDLNNVPLAMVDRIEVDENGSSAVYGSDAIAGVVNIVLKKDFDGVAANAKYSWAKNVGTAHADVAMGKQGSRGGVSLIGSFSSDGGLLDTQRALTASNDYTGYGGPDNNYPICSPGNVFTTGMPLPGGPAGSAATYAAVIASGTSGRPGYSQFAYGTLNRCSFINGYTLLPSKRTAGILLQGHLDVSPAIEAFTEVMFTHVNLVTREGYQSLFGLPGFQAYTVSAANPYNPFGVAVGIAESLHQVPATETYATDFFRPLMGLKGKVAREWEWELSAWQSTDWTLDSTTNLIPNSAGIQNALNSQDPNTALNPFVDGPVGSESLLRTLFSDGRTKLMGRDRSAEAFIRGPALRLPSGKVQTVIGADYVSSTLSSNAINDGVDPPNTRRSYSRRYDAAFGEARIPLLARHLGSQSWPVVSLTLAGRYDHYSDFGGATTKQLGIEVRPVTSILFRGTYSDAFAAPSLPNLDSTQNTLEALIRDPQTGMPTQVRLITGGNPDLRPLMGRSQTAGLVYSGDTLPGLRLGITQWQISESDNIEQVSSQVLVDNAAAFPGRVIRDSSGSIVEVIDTSVNFGSIKVAGVDYHLDFRKRLNSGSLSAAADAVETYRYTQSLAPGRAAIGAVSKAQDDGNWAPRWKGTVSLGWTERELVGFIEGRYTGAYQDYDSTRRIGNYWIFDANLRCNIGMLTAAAAGWERSAYAELGATNLFNRAPQFSNFNSDFYGFDASQASILGRSVYVNLGIRW